MNKSDSMGRWWCAGALAAALVTGCSQNDGGSGGGGGGGGTGGAAACDLHDPAVFGVSASLFEGDSFQAEMPPNYPTVSASASGTVTSVGTGALPMVCGTANAGTEGAWVKLDDADGKAWTACYAGAGATMPLQVGDAVAVEYAWSTQEWGLGNFDLALRKDGALVVYVLDESHTTPTLPEGITVQDGQKLCSYMGSDGCGFDRHEMVATAGSDSVTLSPGESGVVGGFEIHLGYWSTTVLGEACDGEEHARGLYMVAAP